MANICCSSVSNAVINNNLKKVQELIKEGQRLDIPDNLGYTPLHIAAKKLSTGCVNLLLRQPDIPINVKSFEGFTSLYLACDNTLPPLKLITNLLKHGADPDLSNNEGVTPFHIVCKAGNLSLAKLLFKYGANINIKDIDDDTPLHFAVDGGQRTIVDYLLKIHVDTSVTNNYGLNPLMLAIVRKSEDIFNMILPCTDNLNEVGKRKETAISLAISVGNLNILRNLIEHGASVDNSNAKSPMLVPELYAQDRFDIFKFIWSQMNHFTISDNEDFALLVSAKLKIRKHFPHLKLIFESGVNFRFKSKGINHTIKHIFRTKTDVDLLPVSFFMEHKKTLKRIITALVYQEVDVCIEDVNTLLKFFKFCPFRTEILKILLESKDFIVDETVIFSIFWYDDIKTGLLFLQHIPNQFDTSELINTFIDTEKYDQALIIIQYFTPSDDIIKKLIQVTNREKAKQILEVHYEGKVKSLKEIARDKTRAIIRTSMNINLHPVQTIDQTVKKLSCPQDVKDILLFNKCINARLF